MSHKAWPRRGALAIWAEQARYDVVYGWRGLRRASGFTLTIVVVLALGLGANAALFSLLDRIFLREPSGVVAPRQIRRLYYLVPQPELRLIGPADAPRELTTYPAFTAMRDAVGGNAQLTAYHRPDSVDARIAGAAVPVMVSYVTRDYFSMLGVRPPLGRVFSADEDRVEIASPVAVISDALWHRAFAGDPTVLGKQISIARSTFTVIGVAPRDFSGIDLDRVDIWLPLGTVPPPPFFTGRWYLGGFGAFRVIARVSSSVAERKLKTLATVAYRRVDQDEGVRDTTSAVITGPLISALGPTDPTQNVPTQEYAISLRLAGVSLLLLLISIGNVANLQLIRGMRRRREIAIRRALGITKARLYRQLFTESLLLSTLGATAAVLIGAWASLALRELLLPAIHWSDDLHPFRLIAFTALASVIAGTLAGMAPAFHASDLDLNEALKTGAKSGRQRTWSWKMLTVGQAALSIVLLVGAGLFMRSLRNVRAIDLGFDTENLVSMTVRTPNDSARSREIEPAFEAAAMRLTNFPGVEHVAIARQAPMQGYFGERFFLPDRDSVPKIDNLPPLANYVSPEFFSTMGVRVVAGRVFTSDDRAGAAPVAIVSRTMAAVAWPGEKAIGKCIQMLERTAPCTTVVGVVDDTHLNHIIEPKHFMQFYLPLPQSTEFDRSPRAQGRFLIVRARSGAESAVTQLALRETRERLPGMDVRATDMTRVLEHQFRPWRLGATLFSILGALAALVAMVGMYSVIAYSASQRAHEMSIRIALGAQVRDIVDLVTQEGLRVVIVSIAIGTAFAAATGRLVSSLVYGVSTRDPLVYVGACVLLATIGLAASLIPALRVARCDPANALRAE